jgi:hypothetical protein
VVLIAVGSFIVLVWTAQILTQPAPSWLRGSGVVMLIALAIFAWRWATVSVVVTADGIRARGVWSTREFPWAAIRGLGTRPSGWTPMMTLVEMADVVLELADGSEARPLALVRKAADARAIADDLDRIRRSLS